MRRKTDQGKEGQVWMDCHDPRNRQNKNAGNAGDLVKHTVYLAVVDSLLQADPWRDHLRVRECHAGRGLYRIPSGDRRMRSLKVLCDPVDDDNGVLLHDRQRAAQRTLRVWPSDLGGLGWYAGSAALNTQRLASASGRHRIELYERELDNPSDSSLDAREASRRHRGSLRFRGTGWRAIHRRQHRPMGFARLGASRSVRHVAPGMSSGSTRPL